MDTVSLQAVMNVFHAFNEPVCQERYDIGINFIEIGILFYNLA